MTTTEEAPALTTASTSSSRSSRFTSLGAQARTRGRTTPNVRTCASSGFRKATAAAATGDAGVYVLLVNNFGTTNPNGSQVGVLAITSAQIKTLNSVGLQLLAAPGAGKVTIIERLVFEMIPSGTAYTSGGALNAYWAGGSAIFSGSIPATVVTASGTTKSITTLSAKTETNGVTESVNTAINLQAETGDFATGTGTAYVWVVYRTLTLA
jgi:hypothetical protein